MNECGKTDKPHLVLPLADQGNLATGVQAASEWIMANLAMGGLNVAGPRASRHPSVSDRAMEFVAEVLGE